MNLREWALPVYTILMQLAVGALLVLWVIRAAAKPRFAAEELDRIVRNPLLIISITVAVAMIGSHFHLSRPFHSFYALRNYRTSWLSREIIFTLLFFLSLASTWLLSRYRVHRRVLIEALGWVATAFGLTMVYCMARIYLLPTQLAWNSPTVIVSFYGTTLLLGIMTIACLLVMDLKFAEIQKDEDLALRAQVIKYLIMDLVAAALVMAVFEIGITFFQLRQLVQSDPILVTSRQLLFGLYGPIFFARLLLLGGTPIWMTISVVRIKRSGKLAENLIAPVYFSCLLMLIAEIIGRFLLYATHIRVGI